MPSCQSFGGEGSCVQACGVKNHFHDTIHVSVGGHECSNIYAKPSCDRRANGFCIKMLTFDFACFEDIRSQSFKGGLIL